MTVMTDPLTADENPWCVLAEIDFKTGFDPCVALSVHRNKRAAQKVADALRADKYWPTKAMLVAYTESVSKLKVGDYLLNKKVDSIMDCRDRNEVAE